MTRKRERLTLLETRENESRSDIIAESKHWILQNKGLKLESEKSCNYPSPRISSEIMDCSMPMTFDQYNYCSLGCLYCFAYFFKSNNPAVKDMGLKSINNKKLIHALQGKPDTARGRLMYEHFFKKKFLLHWGGLADPFCSFEKSNSIGYPLLEALGDLNYPTLFSFKGRTIFDKKYVRLFDKYSKQKNFAFQASIITGDDEMAKNVEIGVPSPTMRLKALEMLSNMGYFTILRLRPFIIGVSEKGLDDLLHRALEAGIKGVSMEFFAMDTRSNTGMKARYDWLAKFIGTNNLMRYFKNLSPKERGGYMRLNRLIKDPFVKQVYRFCVKHNLVFGCSDPDFKELCTSGSCCAMPDHYPENKGLEHWTRNQLTYWIKECRRAYHRKGEVCKLRFSQVYGRDSTYLDDIELTNDHVGVSSMTNVERYNHTYRTMIQSHWNNLRSYANPRNYFHGKLMPIGVDEEDNLIYKYNPMEYEERWKEEGIDLTK